MGLGHLDRTTSATALSSRAHRSHLAHVVVDGAIAGDRIEQGRPYILDAKGADGLVDLTGIADLYTMLHNQPQAAWTHELDVRTHKEEF